MGGGLGEGREGGAERKNVGMEARLKGENSELWVTCHIYQA